MKEKDAGAIAAALHSLAVMIAPSLSPLEVIDALLNAEEKKKHPVQDLSTWISAGRMAKIKGMSKATLLRKTREGKYPHRILDTGFYVYPPEEALCPTSGR